MKIQYRILFGWICNEDRVELKGYKTFFSEVRQSSVLISA